MRRALKIPVYISAVFLLIIVAAIYLYIFTTLPERELNSWIGYRALRDSGYNITFQRINRDLWRHLELEGLEIAPGENAAGPTFKAKNLRLEYSIAGIIKGKYSFELIRIDTVAIGVPMAGKSEGEEGSENPFSIPFSVSAKEIQINSVNIVLGNGEAIYMDSISLSAAAEKDGISVDLLNLNARWPARDFEINRLSGKIASVSDGYRLESIHLITGRSDLFINGNVGESFTKGLDLAIGCQPIDLEDIYSLTGVKLNGSLESVVSLRGDISEFSGEAKVDGIFMSRPFDDMDFSYKFNDKKLSFTSIDGSVFHAAFKGNGQIDFNQHPEQYVYEGTVRHLDLREIGPDLKTDFTGKVTFKGQSFSENNLKMQAKCELDSVIIDQYFFSEASGTVKFDLSKIEFMPDFKARYKHTYLDAIGSLEYKGDIDLSGHARFEDLTDFTDQIFLKKLGGRGFSTFDVTGPTLDFSVDANFDSDSAWTYGLEPDTIHIDASLKSFISHRVGIVSGNWLGGGLYSVPTDSGMFSTSVSGEMAFMDTVQIYGLEGGLWFHGVYDGSQIPPVFVADTLHGEIFSNAFDSAEPIEISIYERETEIDKFILKYLEGTANLSGIVTNDLDMDLQFLVENFQIQPIMKQIYPEKDFQGIWSGDADMTGNFVSPNMNFDFDLDSLSIDGSLLGHLSSLASYSNGYLTTDSTVLSSITGEYRFKGRLPMDLSFEEVEKRLPDDPIYLTLETSGKRLLLAEIFIDAVDRYDTDFDLNLTLTGTYSKPNVAGSGKLLRGMLKTQYLRNWIQNINAYVRMENELIYIDSVFASVQEPGKQDFTKRLGGFLSKPPTPTINGNGTLELLSLNNFLYDLTISGKNVFFRADAYDVTGRAGFDLKIQGETPPTISGDITLQQLGINDDFDKFVAPDYDATVAAVEDSTMWDLDLNVTAPNNIWIKNRDIDAEFKADIHVQRHVGIIGALGTLEAVRGSYNVLGDKGFRFQSGTITYPDLATIDPNIDFTVVKQIQVRQSESGSTEPLTMELHITGTLLVPKIDVPGFTKEEALKLLISSSWASRTISGERSSADYFSGINAIATQMGLDPSTVQGIFDELSITDIESSKGAKLDLAKYVSPNLYVRYSRRLRDPESSIGFEYYLNKNFSVRATQGMKGSQNEGFSIDINLNYEY